MRGNIAEPGFWVLYRTLPRSVKAAARSAFQRFCNDPTHPALRLHRLKPTARGQHRPGTRAVNVGRRHRALFVVRGHTNVWYWIGSHADDDAFTGVK